jgi:hypothetical protein
MTRNAVKVQKPRQRFFVQFMRKNDRFRASLNGSEKNLSTLRQKCGFSSGIEVASFRQAQTQ